jgi:hypothetical protein
MSVTVTSPSPTTGRLPRSAAIAAGAVAVMVAGQFAMLAVVPVVIVVVSTWRNVELRALRWWAAGLAVAFATPLALWAIGPDRAPSLSKDMHPALAAVVVAAAVAYVAAWVVVRRRRAVPATGE